MNINPDTVLEGGLQLASELVKAKAYDIAPFKTGKLRESIYVNNSRIKQWQTKITTKWVYYATLRHYINYKNPQTLLYLHRWYDESKDKINNIFKLIVWDMFSVSAFKS